MRKVVLFLALLCCVAVASAYVLCDTDDDPGQTVCESAITYNLNGGTLPIDAPSTYIEGEHTALPEPYMDGRIFLGWYAEAEIINPVPVISDSHTGDVEVHALWGDDPLGTSITLSGIKLGEGVFSRDLMQSVTLTFGQDVNGMRPVRMDFISKITLFGQSTDSSSGDVFWLSSLKDRASYAGIHTYDGKICTVWDVPVLDHFRFWIYQGYPILIQSPQVDMSSRLDSTKDVYDITYHVDDADRLSGYVPTRYCKGVYTPLPNLEANGFFNGWFVDSARTTPIGAVSSTFEGDLALYPMVDPEGLVGRGYTMEVNATIVERSSGGFLQPFTTTTTVITGTESVMYLAKTDSAYYVRNAHDLLYTVQISNFFSSSSFTEANVGSSGYWTDENDSSRSFMYAGNVLVAGNLCEVWVSEDSDVTITQYVYLGYLPMRIVYDYADYDVEYTLHSQDTYAGDTDLLPMVMSSPGIEVTGTDGMAIGQSFTLVASGPGFDGWYEDGTLVTEEPYLTVDRATPGIHYEARAIGSIETFDTYSPDISGCGLDGVPDDWTIYDAQWNEVVYGDLEGGTYVIVDGCEPVHHSIRIRIGVSEYTFTWEYSGKVYTVSVDISESDVLKVSEEDPYDNNRTIYSTEAYVQRYFTTDEAYMMDIANQLAGYRISSGFDDQQFAQFVLSMVQQIDYLTDEYTRQSTEFFKYPVEYIYDGGGDCEDSSIFYAVLMDILGYEAGIVIFQDHCMAVVAVDGFTYSGVRAIQTIVVDGVTYYFCETTAEGWRVGETSNADLYGSSTVRYDYYV